MAYKLELPDIGEGVVEAEIAAVVRRSRATWSPRTSRSSR